MAKKNGAQKKPRRRVEVAGKPSEARFKGLHAARLQRRRTELSGKEHSRELASCMELVKLQEWVTGRASRSASCSRAATARGQRRGTISGDHRPRGVPRVFRVRRPACAVSRAREVADVRTALSAALRQRARSWIFDRSWCNRAGVERMWASARRRKHASSLKMVPAFEKIMVRFRHHPCSSIWLK